MYRLTIDAMRPRNQTGSDPLAAALARRSAASAADLAAQLGVSIATLHRLLPALSNRLLVTGKARRTRYALRRPLRGDLSGLPLYALDPAGRAEQVSHLAAVHPQGTWMDLANLGWPVPDESRDGWWDGLPYPLYDMQPNGYMGRQVALAWHHRLGVAASPSEWGDDDILQVLSNAGADVSGNLILGNPAFEQWQASRLAPPEPVPAAALGAAYLRLAEAAVASGVPGSSAVGEFPKFTALRDLAGSRTPHVLVKFSGADGSPTVQRWADLLVCEHLALGFAATLPGVQAAQSRIVIEGGRTFLELERFDRQGLFGRSPLLSLSTVAAALLGDVSADWSRLAAQLAAAGWLGADDVLRVQHLGWFGRLIANTDMHPGNLSLRPSATVADLDKRRTARGMASAGRLALAPTYDMLPMGYAPLPGGELPAWQFQPPLPLPPQRVVWAAACTAAIGLWQAASLDQRISPGFRQLCAANAQQLARLEEGIL